MDLTKEHFDKGLANLMGEIADIKSVMVTKDELEAVKSVMVTKDELKNELAAQTAELKQYTNEAFETQQVWIDERFDELIKTYDVRDRVAKLETEFHDFKLKSNLQ